MLNSYKAECDVTAPATARTGTLHKQFRLQTGTHDSRGRRLCTGGSGWTIAIRRDAPWAAYCTACYEYRYFAVADCKRASQ